MKGYYIYLFICGFTLLSCNKEAEIDSDIYEPKVVIEGSIENGSYASVQLSISAPLSDSLTLLNYVIRSAKVTVSDSEQSEVLSLQTTNKINPFEYVGSSIIGKPGKQYHLKVEYRNKTITAQTEIPEPVVLDSIWFKKEPGNDSVTYIHVKFNNSSNHFYQIATRQENQGAYIPCLYGNIDPSLYGKGQGISMQINKGPVIFPKTDYRTYFVSPSDVEIRFSTQTKESYEFWTSYENEVLNAQNPIFPANSSLKSNIKGGIGIWAGYGTFYYKINLK